MLPQTLEADPSDATKHRGWAVLRRDSMTALPGFPLSADVISGTVTMRRVIMPAAGDQAEKHEDSTFDFGPDGIRIIPRSRR